MENKLNGICQVENDYRKGRRRGKVEEGKMVKMNESKIEKGIEKRSGKG